MKEFRKRLPAGWRRGLSEELACPHRDMSVCATCVAEHAHQVFEVYGVHYWAATAAEAAMLKGIAS